MHLHCRALNTLKRVLNEDAFQTPPSATPNSKNDELIVVDDSPVNREMTIKVKCHGIVQRYKIRQVDLYFILLFSESCEKVHTYL